MIHEVLLYLWSCEGSLGSHIAEDEWFNMIELRDFLHPCDRKLLERILQIARENHDIQEFIKTVLTQKSQIEFQENRSNLENMESRLIKCNISEEKDEDLSLNLQGLYLKAFCNSLDVVLEDYRNCIVDTEKAILKDPQLPLTFVLSQVEKYKTLFEALKMMIRVIKTEKLYGCLLIGRLLKYCNCGINQVANAASRIICSINIMFYRHLCNWIIFGDLVDVHQEFFICDAKCADEDFLWSLSLHDSKSDLESFSESLRGYRVRRPPTVQKFYVRENMVPSNITLELAETILFMGRMVWIIRNDPTNSQDNKLKLRLKRDIWDGKETYYFQKIQELENEPFNLSQFEKAIEDCRLCLTKYLRTVMVEEAKMFEHLQLLRDYYAMGRGELFQQFIIAVEENLNETPIEYLAFKLNAIFKETAKKIYSESDKTHKRFELILPNDPDSFTYKKQWLNIEMNCEIVWPLHIIFHPGAMLLYNKLFNFLMRVKKAQIDLDNLWLNHMEGKRKIHRGVWSLRNTLTFIINNLQYYLQVDVIEAQFAVLIKSVTNAQNIENIIKLHADFLGNLLSRTFLMTMNNTSVHDTKNQLYKLPSLDYDTVSTNQVHATLMQFLTLCDEFCTHAIVWSSELNDLEQMELQKLQVKCDRLVEFLLATLYSLREQTSGNHLLQLLHRIDFNRWFTKNKPDFNLSTV